MQQLLYISLGIGGHGMKSNSLIRLANSSREGQGKIVILLDILIFVQSGVYFHYIFYSHKIK